MSLKDFVGVIRIPQQEQNKSPIFPIFIYLNQYIFDGNYFHISKVSKKKIILKKKICVNSSKN